MDDGVSLKTSIELWTSSPGALRLGSALLHFVWQGAVLAAGIGLLLLCLRRANARVRYLVQLVGLGLMAACPIVTWSLIPVDVAPAGMSVVPESVLNSDSRSVEPEFTAGPVRDAGPIEKVAATPPLLAGPEVDAPMREASTVEEPDRIDRWRQLESKAAAVRPWCVVAWLGGVCLFSLRIVAGLVGLEWTRRQGSASVDDAVATMLRQLAQQMGIRRAVRVFQSATAEIPTLVGWLRPVILLPATALTGLSPSQLQAVLAHELAHVQRHDALVNLLQLIVETLLFYHPAVWWLSRRIRAEREHCCDDIAVALCGDRIGYARALATLEKLRPAPRWAVAASGGSLVTRIRRIVGRPESVKARPGVVAAVVFATLLSVWMSVGLQAVDPPPTDLQVQLKKGIVNTEQLVAPETAPEQRHAGIKTASPSESPSVPFKISGLCVDSSDQPIGGTRIVLPLEDSALFNSRRATYQTVSNGDGEFNLELDQDWVDRLEGLPKERAPLLWAYHAGYVLISQRLDLPVLEPLKLVLSPDHSVEFQIADNDGHPIAATTVEPHTVVADRFAVPEQNGHFFRWEEVPQELRVLLRAASDTEGKVQLSAGLRNRMPKVRIDSPTHGLQVAGLNFVDDSDPYWSSATISIDKDVPTWNLTKPGRITGQLSSPETLNLGRVQIAIMPRNSGLSHVDLPFMVLSDSEGRFESPPLHPGEYSAWQMLDKERPTDLRVVFPEAQDVKPGEVLHIVGNVVRAESLRGSILDRTTGKPVNNITIRAITTFPRQFGDRAGRPRWTVGESRTDEHGQFQLSCIPGTVHSLHVDSADWSLELATRPVPDDWIAKQPFVLYVEPLDRIRGLLIDSNGKPVARALVSGRTTNLLSTVTLDEGRTNNRGEFVTRARRSTPVRAWWVTGEGMHDELPDVLQEEPLILQLRATKAAAN